MTQIKIWFRTCTCLFRYQFLVGLLNKLLPQPSRGRRAMRDRRVRLVCESFGRTAPLAPAQLSAARMKCWSRPIAGLSEPRRCSRRREALRAVRLIRRWSPSVLRAPNSGFPFFRSADTDGTSAQRTARGQVVIRRQVIPDVRHANAG